MGEVVQRAGRLFLRAQEKKLRSVKQFCYPRKNNVVSAGLAATSPPNTAIPSFTATATEFALETLVSTSHAPGTSAVPVRTSGKRRLGTRLGNYVKALCGTPSKRRLARAALKVNLIRFWEKEFSKLNDAELRQRGLQMRGRARGGESLHRLLPEAFGLVCVAAHRMIKLRPFDVQLAAGVIMHNGALAELATGEGKTLCASLPTFLNALTGKGVHVTTVNDYLARRDAEWIGPIYRSLGLTVGALQQKMSDHDRVEAYKADITYGMASEFGFDFLRDRLKVSGDKNQTAP